MPSMTAAITRAEAASRPELPRRSIGHERTPDRPTPSGGRPHPQTAHVITTAAIRPGLHVRSDADRSLADLLLRMVREQDARIPAERRTPRTLAAMQARMANDSCPLCGRWNCDPSSCPPSAVPAAAPTMSGDFQCDVCGGWFGVTGAHPANGIVTGWTCGACQNIQA
ncbi:hypothetical protein ACFYRN_38845 [Streptomyces sp. NPDC005227]|uniref:hypothetical protein n=1 Tax=Streptomyces sp. NPDC005227 TaxID=3364707 RepID=UPI003698320F